MSPPNSSREGNRNGRAVILLGGILILPGAMAAVYLPLVAPFFTSLGAFLGFGCALWIGSALVVVWPVVGAISLGLRKRRPRAPGQS